MGFSLKKMFSGSGWRKFKHAVGGVVSIATSVIPGVGGLAGKGISKLLAAKGAVGGIARTAKTGLAVSKALRHGKALRGQGGFIGRLTSTAAVLKASPVMPGGGIATPSGVAPARANPPATYGGRKSGGTKRRKRRGSAMKRSRAGRKRGGRKPKFGSPAWRKKYRLDKPRRKRRR